MEAYLYPWFVTNLPTVFSVQTALPDSAPSSWRGLFLGALVQAVQRRHQLADILAAFAEVPIDVIVLKGSWLSETVYDDPAQRTMSDIDLLIRASDRDACHACLRTLGYAARTDTLHNRFAYDQSYVHPVHRKPVELHWHVASDMASGTPKPDIEAIWQNTSPAICCGQPVRALSPADQLAHLVHHTLHHLFAMPLRGYVDLALLLRKSGAQLTPEALDTAGTRWRTGGGIPFLLRLTRDLLALQLPSGLEAHVPELDPSRRDQALQALFDLPTPQARSGETTLLRFQASSPLGRLRLVLDRIFMPRTFMVMRYPYARHAYGLPFAWFRRACDLRRQNRTKLKAILTPGTAEAQLLSNAASRADLTDWLLRG